VAWSGAPARPNPDTPPVTGFDVAKDIKAPFLGLYGEKDQGPPPADAVKLGEMFKGHNPNSEVVIYPDAGHGLFADYRSSYNAAATADGWKRCLAVFDKHLQE
jgi:carboxymethylenebutenolidase